MKTPRINDFDPHAKIPPLGSPLEGMPAIAAPMRNLKTQDAGFPGTQESINPVSQEPRNPALQKPVNPGTQGTPKRASYPKQTFNIHPDIVDMLEDTKRILKRRFAIKTSKEEITEIAIELLCQDFQQKQEASTLLTRLKKTQEPRNP